MNYIHNQVQKAHEHLETLLKKPEHIHLVIEGPPNFTVSKLDEEKLAEILTIHPEYDELQYMRDNGIEILSCELTPDGYKIEKMDVLSWCKS